MLIYLYIYIYIYIEREREREREREEACNLCKKIPKIKSKRSLIKLWSLRASTAVELNF